MSTVLGFDTSTATLAVAVTREGEVVLELGEGPGPDGRPRHSARLLSEVERCVEAAGGWEQVDRIAVGVGPGSFTGLRIGIATARALAQARELPLAAVGTLAALARAIEEQPAAEGLPALPVIDARRGQAFAAAYDGGRGAEGAGCLLPFELGEIARSLDSAPLAAGDGALIFAEELTRQAPRLLRGMTPFTGWRRGTSALSARKRPSRHRIRSNRPI